SVGGIIEFVVDIELIADDVLEDRRQVVDVNLNESARTKELIEAAQDTGAFVAIKVLEMMGAVNGIVRFRRKRLEPARVDQMMPPTGVMRDRVDRFPAAADVQHGLHESNSRRCRKISIVQF